MPPNPVTQARNQTKLPQGLEGEPDPKSNFDQSLINHARFTMD